MSRPGPLSRRAHRPGGGRGPGLLLRPHQHPTPSTRLGSRPQTGQDHWAGAFFAWPAGGVQGGQVVGKSDRVGAYPVAQPYYPSDLGATIYEALGVDPAVEVRDQQGRPLRLNLGQVIQPLYRGA